MAAKNLSNRILLLLILLVAAGLRFYNLLEIPFTKDEFSALFRTEFDSFSELIDGGVRIDGHPAGVQVFLFYWTRLIGTSEWIVKIPFILMGISSVLLICGIAKQWYNETVALIVASFIATLEYTVMYSQIARPYVSGLFFSLTMVYFWSKIILRPNHYLLRNCIGFILAASLCSYNHHFSLLFAALVGLSGLFLIQKEYLWRYVSCGIVIFILYLPHLNIFLYQLNMGGIGGSDGWLGAPENDFIINYIRYLFHFSPFVLTMVLLLICYGFYSFNKRSFDFKKLFLFTGWFFLPILIGVFYSQQVNPVLQYSVLIFSFPFLLFILFGHIREQKLITNAIIIVVILSVNVFSLMKERNYYPLFYNSVFERILEDHQSAQTSSESVISMIRSHGKITEYYCKKNNIDSNFIWVDNFNSLQEFTKALERMGQYSSGLFLGCHSGINPLIVPLIKDYFPTLEWKKNYEEGNSYFFSRNTSKEENIVGILDLNSESDDRWTSVQGNRFIPSEKSGGDLIYLVDSISEWSPAFKAPLYDIISHENDFIDISLECELVSNSTESVISFELESQGEKMYWSGTACSEFIPENFTSGQLKFHHSVKLSDVNLNHDDIRVVVYLWNKGKENLPIKNFKIKLRKGNPVVYGLYEKFS